jgi:hypothetical protein
MRVGGIVVAGTGEFVGAGAGGVGFAVQAARIIMMRKIDILRIRYSLSRIIG